MTDQRGLLVAGIEHVLLSGSLRAVFQPIVDLDSGRVVACEALARGPVGPWESPAALFPAARDAGVLAELDLACRLAAFRGAVDAGLLAPLTLFVNVEPEVLDQAPLADLLAIADGAPGELRVVLEITERALAERPAELLQTVARVRQLGWGIALDDVGADAMSLAFMPLLRPDVVKLDLRLVQERPGPAIAQIMNAVNAYAERSGALILAEGIETPEHLKIARALGATLGQGWMFGRPGPAPTPGSPDQWSVADAGLVLPVHLDASAGVPDLVSPFSLLPAHVPVRRSPKSLLIEVSKQIEREAMRLGDTCVVATTFQEARHFTPATAQRYRDMVARVGFACALGEDLPGEPLPGLRGATLSRQDPVRGEWDVVVVSPHFAVALLARDLGDTGPELDRSFEFALTYDRDTVIAAAQALISRVAPRVQPLNALGAAASAASSPVSLPASATPHALNHSPPLTPRGGSTLPDPILASGSMGSVAQSLLERAVSATASGVTIVDMTSPDQPLVFVNRAFAEMAGYPSEELLGRNCRLLQGPDSDPAVSSRIRAAISAGRECKETVLNHRGPDRVPWWNEMHLAPVVDASGVVRQYIGVQTDVTARVRAERDLQKERDRSQTYLSRIERLAWTDPLTGLSNRRRFQDDLDTMLWDARAAGTAVGLLFLDLNGFKAVNDTLGHATGDELLIHVAGRITARLRHSDLSARLGGDEFLVALPGLTPNCAADEAAEIGRALLRAIADPLVVQGNHVHVGATVGISVHPDDGDDFQTLLHVADQQMYAAKRQAMS